MPSARQEAQSSARELLALAGTAGGNTLDAAKHTEAKKLPKSKAVRGKKRVRLAASAVFAKQFVPVLPSTNL